MPTSPSPPSPANYDDETAFRVVGWVIFVLFFSCVLSISCRCKCNRFRRLRLYPDSQLTSPQPHIDHQPPANSSNPARNNNVLHLNQPPSPNLHGLIDLPPRPAANRTPSQQASIVFTRGTTGTSTNAATDECVICLDGFVDGQVCRLLSNCQHSFHKLCIDQWLATGKPYCPVCRAPIKLSKSWCKRKVALCG
ncbi:hypothetical protein EV2_030273 [Malus domestica]